MFQIQSWPTPEIFVRSGLAGGWGPGGETAVGMIYYVLDTEGPIAIDVASGKNTNVNSGTRTVVSGIISQGWEFPGGAAELLPETEIPSKKYSVRFWFKNLLDLSLPGTSYDFLLTRYFSCFPADGAVVVGRVGGIVSSAPVDTNDNQWHRVLFQYNPDTSIFLLQVDDGTPVIETLDESDLTSGGTAVDMFPHTLFDVPGCVLDEVLIGPDFLWTQADSIDDWNGGDGQTYPNVPGRDTSLREWDVDSNTTTRDQDTGSEIDAV